MWANGERLDVENLCRTQLNSPGVVYSSDESSSRRDSSDALGLKMVVLCCTQWNFTHYTYTCSSGDLESDTLHLYLQGPEGCTQISGILH
ncbi:unnamed protein product [Pleuronectes platessa]|uniref:Uncharacterized protein n=1 Tax=Pleuronectes platessa TaxID=8262 RepID=A0A9N7VY71_PLEPL|nr:unnamed protein product [Pleuronectes platessa]